MFSTTCTAGLLTNWSAMCQGRIEPIPNHPSRYSSTVYAKTLSGQFSHLCFSPISTRTCAFLRELGVSPFRAVLPGVRVQPWRLQSRVRLFCIELSVSPFSARPYLTPCCTRMGRVQPWLPGNQRRRSYGSGILRIRFSHSSASVAPQISTSSSIASPMGKDCGTTITPGLEPRV